MPLHEDRVNSFPPKKNSVDRSLPADRLPAVIPVVHRAAESADALAVAMDKSCCAIESAGEDAMSACAWTSASRAAPVSSRQTISRRSASVFVLVSALGDDSTAR